MLVINNSGNWATSTYEIIFENTKEAKKLKKFFKDNHKVQFSNYSNFVKIEFNHNFQAEDLKDCCKKILEKFENELIWEVKNINCGASIKRILKEKQILKKLKTLKTINLK